MQYLRLKKNNDFQRLFKKGKRVFSPYLTLLYRPSQKLTMGIAVSKKHGKAVVRNRIKRLVRAVFAANSDKLNGAYSIVILPKAGVEYSFSNFEKSLLSCFKKINAG